MSHAPGVRRQETDTDSATVASPDALFDALASRFRREALSILHSSDRPVTESDLATRVAARTADKSLVDVRRGEHDEARTRLHHVHLPKLAAAGLIRRDERRGVVSATHSPVFYRSSLDDLCRFDWEADAGETDAGETDAGETDAERRDAEKRDAEGMGAGETGDVATISGPDDLDAVLSALADGRRRRILSMLKDADGQSLALYDLAARLAADADTSVCSIRTGLRHVHLPVLADAGLVAYDAEAGTVSFDGTELDDRWFEAPFAPPGA